MEIKPKKKEKHIEEYFLQIKKRSDMLMNFFLAAYFLMGLFLATYYDTWLIAFGVGGLSLVAYYSAKLALPRSNFYQYVLSVVLAAFMAQFIYQMHGLFEMHFFAFVGSAILISYQNWKLQIPLALVVIVHHAVFGYMQYIGYNEIYFTQLEYMPLQTFIMHGAVAAVIFFLCGLWAYSFKQMSHAHIVQGFEIGKLQESEKQKEALISMSEDLKESNERLKEAQHIANTGNWEYDAKNDLFTWSDEMDQILERVSGNAVTRYQVFIDAIQPKYRDELKTLTKNCIDDNIPFELECKINTAKGRQKNVSIRGKSMLVENSSAPKVIGIIQDITDRKIAEEERERMLADMFQRNKDLEQFSYIISHNLRSPVSYILGFSEALKEEDVTEEEREKFIDALSVSVKKLDTVIRDLTYILQVKNEVSELKEKVLFANLVHDIKMSINDMIESNHVQIDCDFTEIDNMITIKSYLYSIFYNLISNSIKYRRPDVLPIITIASRKQGAKVVLTFKDNGMGIDLAKKGNEVFGLYKRFHTHAAEGKGMGLYMTKAQVETLNGSIGIKSKVNVGTEIVIEFGY